MRRLCPHCKIPLHLSEPVLSAAGFAEQELNDLVIYGPQGCDRCLLGYQGRIGIYEVMPLSRAMQRQILEGANAMDIATQARQEKMLNLKQAGLNKVRQGITSLAEIDRVN